MSPVARLVYSPNLLFTLLPPFPRSDAGAMLGRFLVSRTTEETPIKLRYWEAPGGAVSAKPVLCPGNQPERRPCFLKGWGGKHGAQLA